MIIIILLCMISIIKASPLSPFHFSPVTAYLHLPFPPMATPSSPFNVLTSRPSRPRRCRRPRCRRSPPRRCRSPPCRRRRRRPPPPPPPPPPPQTV